MQDDTVSLHALGAALHDRGQFCVKRVRESNMADNTTLEKSKGTDALGPVNDLVGDDKVHGLDVLLERAHGRESNDASHADMSKSSNVGSVGNFVRRELVMEAVAGQEGNVDAFVGEDADGRGRRTPGRHGIELGDGLIPLELAETGAADDGDVDGFWEEKSVRNFYLVLAP